MMKIAVVEDEPNISNVVSLYLERAGFEVTTFSDGLIAFDEFAEKLPDLVILDVMLPSMDGFSLLRSIRERSEVPVILLTSRHEESDRIAGLELGADDYVVKPFFPQELVSRVRAVFRRMQSKPELASPGIIQIANLTINPQTREVSVNGNVVILTSREYDLLYHLASHPRQVFSRDQLLGNIWGLRDFIDPSTVTVHIRRLREKIENDPTAPVHLVTAWGVGYKFEP